MVQEMKDSGILWIGDIPKEWDVKPIKALLEERKENNNPIKTDRILSLTNAKGVIPYNEKGAIGNKSKEDIRGYKLAYPDDIVLNSMNVIIGSVGLSKYFGAVSPVYYTMFSRNEKLFNIEFLNYVFQTESFQKSLIGLGNGIMEIRMRIQMSKLKSVYLPITDFDTQQEIVRTLNERCSEIDRIIEKTKTTIDEYKKYKRSVITEAVTMGMNPNVEIKDSVVEWIKQVPTDWEIRKAKYVLSPLSRDVLPDDGIITCFRDGQVTLRDKRRSDGYTVSDTEHGYQGVEAGDLVIHGMDAFAGAIGISDSRGKCTPVVHVCSSKQCKKYYVYLLRSLAFNDVLMSLSEGIRIRSSDYRNWNKLAKIEVPVPPLMEQHKIADYLDSKCNEIDHLIEKKHLIINELEGYKKSLIYEYITGKRKISILYKSLASVIVYPYFPAAYSASSPRFAQAVLASKIIDETSAFNFGRVKLEKMLFTIENHVGFDFNTEYQRQVAGPFDASIYECEGIIGKRNKWFTIRSSKNSVIYKPTKDKQKYVKYYDKYFKDYNVEIERIINIFKPLTTDQAEIYATLYAVWNDFLIENKTFTNEDMVQEVLNNWHSSKRRFSKDIWFNALEQMRKLDIVPNGYGKRTVKAP